MSVFFRENLHLILGHKLRLLEALGIGVVVALCLPSTWSPIFRGIFAWDVIAIIYLSLTFTLMAFRNTSDFLKTVAAKEDQNRWIILMLMTVASFVSLIAIGTLLSNIKSLDPLATKLHVAFGAATVLASWSMMHMIFAVHYAHAYYGDSNDNPDTYEAYEGLIFPGGKEPVFSDFMYYSFVVGMTCQVSDVNVSSHYMRRVTLAHGVLSFFFNTVILALSVNIAAGLLS